MKFSIESIYTWYRNTIRNPKYRWWVILGTLLYFVSPIDIAPDFIPGIGQLDDVFLLTLLVTEVSQMAIEGFKKK
ncbi:MAG: YkvA family protein, partial [Geitlerinemataceae cyanobacterium]